MRALVTAFLLLASACTDLATYQGTYNGLVAGTEDVSFIRRGFAAGTKMTLELTAPPANGTGGRVSTSDGTFDDTSLLEIRPLAHDSLSLYDFPGNGRLRNYIFLARTSTTAPSAADRDAMVFLSLLERGGVEVRVIAGTGAEDRDLFGLFALDRN